MNPNKPKKEVLDKDLDDGMSISMIAEKYGCHVSTVHSWIKGYGLTGVKGRSKGANKDKTTQAETKQAEEKLMGIIAGAKTKENVSPEISESGPNASPETQAPQTIGGVWENLRLDLVALKRLYVADARKAFKEQLDAMLSEVMEGQAND